MKIHVSREHRALAPLFTAMGLGADADFAAAAIVIPHPLTPGDAFFACQVDGDPLADEAFLIDATLPAPRLIAWSGQPAGDEPSDDRFRRSPMTWGPAALEAFNRYCEEVLPQCAATGKRLLFRPHARHVLCDAPRIRTFLDQWQAGAGGIALDPLLMLEPEMLPHAEDHLRRTLTLLAPRAEATFLHNVAVATVEGDERLVAAPLHAGVLDGATLVDLYRAILPDDHPVILSGPEMEAQLALLRPAR